MLMNTKSIGTKTCPLCEQNSVADSFRRNHEILNAPTEHQTWFSAEKQPLPGMNLWAIFIIHTKPLPLAAPNKRSTKTQKPELKTKVRNALNLRRVQHSIRGPSVFRKGSRGDTRGSSSLEPVSLLLKKLARCQVPLTPLLHFLIGSDSLDLSVVLRYS